MLDDPLLEAGSKRRFKHLIVYRTKSGIRETFVSEKRVTTHLLPATLDKLHSDTNFSTRLSYGWNLLKG